MLLHMNLDACTGCGMCAEVCPAEAIYLTAGKAVIDVERCTACGTCIEACPNGAITLVAPPTQVASASTQVPTVTQTFPEGKAAPGGLALWAGIALALVEHQVAPRLADALVAALERWQSRPKPSQAMTAWRDVIQGQVARGPAHQRRRRGKHS
jgi:NAD-dependent dihydropyrimidine dehydrogenase PreA subunit